MGYLGNHLATITTGIFAAVLTGLWPELCRYQSEKKSLSNAETVQTTTSGSQVSLTEIKQIQNELSSELNELKESVKIKDSEIERLNQEISNLQTLVQIESLKTELANLKMLASERKTKGK